jgi:hypothetical protein
MARSFVLPLLALALSTGCASLANSPEELRTTQRRIREIDGEIRNSVQILAHCVAHSSDSAVQSSAVNGILTIIGNPDPLEILYAQQLTAETVEDVIHHGVALVEKQKTLAARYDSLETKLSREFLQLSRSAAAWSTVKCLASIGLLLFLLFTLFRRVL